MRCVRRPWRICCLLSTLDQCWSPRGVVGCGGCGGGRLPLFCGECSFSGCEPCIGFVVAGGSGVPGHRFLVEGAVVELQPPQFFALWSPGENLGSGLLGRMTVLCPRQHYLLGGAILETQKGRLLLLLAVVGSWVVVVRPPGADGGLFLSSAGLRVASVPLMCLLKTLPWLPLWCGELRALGVVSAHLCSMTTQLMPPHPACRLDLPWRSSLPRLVLGARLGAYR